MHAFRRAGVQETEAETPKEKGALSRHFEQIKESRDLTLKNVVKSL